MHRGSAFPTFQHHAMHALAEHRHVKIHQQASTEPAEAQDGFKLLLLQGRDLLLGTDHEQKPLLHDEIELRGIFHLMLAVGEIERNCAAEVHFQLTQLDALPSAKEIRSMSSGEFEHVHNRLHVQKITIASPRHAIDWPALSALRKKHEPVAEMVRWLSDCLAKRQPEWTGGVVG